MRYILAALTLIFLPGIIIPASAAAPTCKFSVFPLAPVNRAFAVSWTTTNTPTRVWIVQGTTILVDNLAVNGSTKLTLTNEGMKTLKLYAKNVEGTTICKRGVTAQFPEVYANIVPPISNTDKDNDTLRFSSVMTSQSEKLIATFSSATSLKQYRLWTNRCNPAGGTTYDQCNGGGSGSIGKGNVIDFPLNQVTGVTFRTDDGDLLFSSHRRADQCTLAQAAYVLGKSRQGITNDYGSGLDLQFDATAWTHPNPPETPVSNVCVMPLFRAQNIDGIALDYEPQDGRTTAMAQDFLQRFTDLVASFGKATILDTNPLDAIVVQSGLDETNMFAVTKMFDLTSLHLTRDATGAAPYDGEATLTAEFNNQINIITNFGAHTLDPTAIMVTFDLKHPSVSDAYEARGLMISNGIKALKFKLDGARFDAGNTCPDDVASKVNCLIDSACAVHC